MPLPYSSPLVGTQHLKKFVFVNIFVVFFRLEELFMKFACLMSCKLFLLLIPLRRPFGQTVVHLGHLPFFPPVWTTFRNEILSLNLALSNI